MTKKISGLGVAVLALFLGGCSSFPVWKSAPTFHVADFGAKGDGVTDDTAAIQKTILAAAQAGSGATVRLAAKRYRVSAPTKDGEGQYCVTVSKVNGVVIQGVAGATELISTSFKAGMFCFCECTNVQVRGLTIDYDPLPFIQGGITAVDAKEGTFDVQVDEGYPTFDVLAPPKAQWEKTTGLWGIALERATRRFKPGTPSVLKSDSAVHLTNRTWRLKLEQISHARTIAAGDAYAMRAVHGGNALIFLGCNGAVVERVTIYASAGLCMAFVQCEGELVVRRMVVEPRPGTTRLLSGNADGIHCQAVRKGPLVEECHFAGMTDDGMNTYARTLMVTKVVSPTELWVHHSSDLRVGDRIQVLDPRSGDVRGEAQVVTLTNNQRLTLDAPIMGVRTSTNILSGIVSMNNHLDADVVYNLSSCGAGYVIRKNYFGDFRGRGLILRGVNGLIEDNVFERTSGPGIAIANEPHWPEGPIPRDIVIRGNEFREVGLDSGSCHGGAIMIMALALDGAATHAGVKNIRIENNTICNPPAQGIYLRACDGVQLVDNRIIADTSRSFPSSLGLSLATCTNVIVDGLVIRDQRPKTRCGIEIQATVGAGAAGVKILKTAMRLAPKAVAVLDQRVTSSVENKE